MSYTLWLHVEEVTTLVRMSIVLGRAWSFIREAVGMTTMQKNLFLKKQHDAITQHNPPPGIWKNENRLSHGSWAQGWTAARGDAPCEAFTRDYGRK